jgi:hypothetical protein
LEREYGRISSIVSSSASGAELGQMAFYSLQSGTLQETMRLTEFGQVSHGTDGLVTIPAMGFTSEQSLGLYRSAASTLALSYGTFSGAIFSASTTTSNAVIVDKMYARAGANKSFGTATLSKGSVTVATTAVVTNSVIMLSDQGGGSLSSLGSLEVNGITSGTSFTIQSSNALDNSVAAWWIVNAAP